MAVNLCPGVNAAEDHRSHGCNRPHLLPHPGCRRRRRTRATRLRCRIRPGRPGQGRSRGGGLRPPPLRTAAWSAGPNCRRPETNSTISAGTRARARCATKATTITTHRAALSARAGNQVVEHLCARYQARSANPVLKHTIEAGELAAKAGYSRPHTVHCGPGGIFMSALGGANGDDGPAASRSSTTTRSKSSDRGKRTADPSSSPTTSGGTYSRTRSSRRNGPLRR